MGSLAWLLCFVLCTCAQCTVFTPKVLDFNLSHTAHTFTGFAAMLWPGQQYGVAELSNLNIRYIRTTRDDASPEELRELREVCNTLGIKQIYVVWSAPSQYTDSKHTLKDVNGFADWWVKQEVTYLNSVGALPDYLDLMNEMDSGGQWSTGISSTQYATLVKLVRSKLDAAGFGKVKITGPGLSLLEYDSHTMSYMDALDDSALEALPVFTAHAWDDGDRCGGGAGCMVNQYRNGFAKAVAGKGDAPQWVTEYATKATALNGTTYPSPDSTDGYSASFSHAYAVRVAQNSLALLNSGASSVFYWSAQDTSTKSWGFVTAEGLHKPVYYTLRALFGTIHPGAKVVRSSYIPDSGVTGAYAGVYLHSYGATVAIANDASAAQHTTVRLDNYPSSTPQKSISAQLITLAARGSPATKTMDTSKVTTTTLTLRVLTGGVVAFDTSLPPFSLLVATLAW